MTKRHDGGSAFPGESAMGYFPGMTLRDWFAGQAMLAIIGNPSLELIPPYKVAVDAYNAADAMLKERNK